MQALKTGLKLECAGSQFHQNHLIRIMSKTDARPMGLTAVGPDHGPKRLIPPASSRYATQHGPQ